MINPFYYHPCKTLAEFNELPARWPLSNECQEGYVFIKRSFNPEKQHAEYVWEELLKNAYGPLL